MKLKYIDSGQMVVLMALFSVLYCIYGAEYINAEEMLINTVVSVIILAVLAIPLCILSHKREQGINEIAAERWGWLGRIISLLYVLYFITAAVDIIKDCAGFVSERFYYDASPIVCMLLIGVVCAYISYCRAETVCRMSTVLMFMLIITFAVLGISAWDDYTLLDDTQIRGMRIELSYKSFGGIFPYAAAGITSLCVLCSGAGKRTRKGIYLGLAAILTAAVIMIFTVYSVIGDFTQASDYPFLDTVIYSVRKSSFRIDGLFLSVWIIMSAAVISLLLSCGGAALKTAVPAVRCEGIITAAIALALSIIEEITDVQLCSWLYSFPPVPIVLIGVLPLILLFSVKKRRAHI